MYLYDFVNVNIIDNYIYCKQETNKHINNLCLKTQNNQLRRHQQQKHPYKNNKVHYKFLCNNKNKLNLYYQNSNNGSKYLH